MSIIPTEADKAVNEYSKLIKLNKMDLKEKASIFARCANAVNLPIDITSAEVLLKISDKIDEVGVNISMKDIQDIVDPYLSKQENNINTNESV